jgi:GT2 family glycosyltransferase
MKFSNDRTIQFSSKIEYQIIGWIARMLCVDIIIPSKTNLINKYMLENCITSLRCSEPNISFNVIVVETEDKFIRCGQDMTIKFDQKEFCYNHALNQGLKESKNEWVIFANNDLIFKPGFMQEILLAYAMRPDIMSFSPWNSMWAWHERIFPTHMAIREGYRTGHELTGWCIIARREIFETVSFSENVNFWYSDNVYADALIDAGIKHALVTNSKVDHIVSQTKQVTQEEAYASYEQYLRFKNGDINE